MISRPRSRVKAQWVRANYYPDTQGMERIASIPETQCIAGLQARPQQGPSPAPRVKAERNWKLPGTV